MNNNVRHNDPAIGPLDFVTVSVVFAVDMPFGKLRMKVISKLCSDGSFVNVSNQKIGIGLQEIPQCSEYRLREQFIRGGPHECLAPSELVISPCHSWVH